mmetsp:Transcript_12894/g.23965  ORF Transcript_12894/g.23965 Transcript_12894/m.23965 type:complete len:415 (-) Transcript_12894:456-1700(-)
MQELESDNPYSEQNLQALRDIITNPDSSLEEMLDCEYAVLLAQSYTRELNDFITPEKLRRLVVYTTTEPPEDADAARQYKYPFHSAELLYTENLNVHLQLAQNSEILAEFLMFLDNPSPLNPTLAGYFSSIVTILVKFSSVQFLEVVNNLNLFDKFVYHLNSRAIATALLCILQNDHLIKPYLCEQRANTVAKVAAKITLDACPELVQNASYILSTFVMRGRGVNGWQEAFTSLSESFFGNLLDLLTCSSPSIVKAVAEICSSVLTTEAMSMIPESDSAEKFGKAPLISQITSRMPELVSLLASEPVVIRMTTYGIEEPVLGETKIKLIELISDMIKLKVSELNETISSHNFVSVAWSLVLRHQWNSVLHQTFYAFADRLLLGIDCPELRQSLLRANIPESIVNLNKEPKVTTA